MSSAQSSGWAYVWVIGLVNLVPGSTWASLVPRSIGFYPESENTGLVWAGLELRLQGEVWRPSWCKCRLWA